MSEGSQNAQANAEAGKSNENLDAEKLAATNARLLKESQEYKEKYRAALKEKEDLEAKKIAESGDVQAQLEAEKKRAKAALDELGKTKKKVISQAVKDKISKYAGDVFSVEDLIARPKLKEFLKEGLDEDNLDFNDDSAKRYIEEVKKEAPYLWKSTGPIGAHTGRPGAGNVGSSTVDTSKMTGAQLKEYIKNNFK